MLRITFDTNCLISSTLWKTSVSHKLIIRLVNIDAAMFTSEEILDEFSRVLRRDFNSTEKEIQQREDVIRSLMIIIHPKLSLNVVADDSSDNKIIECAVTSNSEYIITYDKHLLKLGEFHRTKIVTPEILFKK